MRQVKSSAEHLSKARAAADKPAALGSDIDLAQYDQATDEIPYQADPTAMPEATKQIMLGAGVVVDDPSQRSGTFIQMDNMPVHFSTRQEGIEMMPVSQALEQYDWVADYWWRAVAVDTDKFTASVELNQANGYFIRALPGQKTDYPLQSCLFLNKARAAQNVHNIIIAEAGSEMHIITGCATAHSSEAGIHMGVSEFYVKPGAKVTFTMIHTWNPEVAVRPRSGIIIEEGGVFLNNYVMMKPVKSLQLNPLTRCVGENAVTHQNSVLVAPPSSSLDVGSRVILEAPNSRAEIVSRAITTGGEITARGLISGTAPDVKGHLECRGLILDQGGTIHAVPELKGNLSGIDLSHEAAVGKIAEEEVEYLMARGLTRNEATAAIVRGFLRVDIEGLPPLLAAELEKAVAESEKDIM